MPTPEQIEAVREIALLSSFGEAETRLAALNEVQWTATVEDMAEWARVKNKHTIIKGDGVEINKDANRLDIRNRVRVRLGLAEVDERGTPANIEIPLFGSFSVKKEIVW